MTIDFHAHVVPGRYLDLVRRGDVPDVRVTRGDRGEVLDVAGGPEGRQVAQRLPLLATYHDPAVRTAAMDAAGVDVHVLSPVQFMYHYWLEPGLAAALARAANDGIAEMVQAEPRRFVGMATLPLQDTPASLAELRRVHALGFRSVEIGTHVAGVPLDSVDLDGVYGLAETLGVTLFVHPYAPFGRERLGRYFLRNLLGNPFETAIAVSHLAFGGVLERFPRLRFCLAHGGGAVLAVAGRLDRGHQVAPECRANGGGRPGDYLPRFWYDTITHDAAALRYLVTRVGSSQVVLGSDYPFEIGDLDPVRTVRALDLDKHAQEAILGGNAATLLGMSA
jgi:aminocarboxymuconate-semialdehyde decarboxylase